MNEHQVSEISSRTLNELEGKWAHDTTCDSTLISTCLQLRKKPIGDYSIEDLRIMIGQHIGIQFLVPLAIKTLESNPLSEGDCYPGDLLNSVLHLPHEYWLEHPDQRRRVEDATNSIERIPSCLVAEIERFRHQKG